MTRPSGPVAVTLERSAPLFWASARARGEIFISPRTTGAAAISSASLSAGFSASAGASAAAGAASPAPFGANSANDSPGLPMTMTLVRHGTSSPSAKKIWSTVPASLASSSKAALSVS